jgi:glutathione peroxidase-family protein
VLAFPTTDFHQELKSDAAVQEFLDARYPDVDFPIFATTSLATNPVYIALRKQMPQAVVQHNFYKYLVNQRGIAVKFYPKNREPFSLKHDIAVLLAEG